MPREYLKKAIKTAGTDMTETRGIVQGLLDEIEQGRDDAARRISARLDKYAGNIVLTQDEIAAASARVSQRLKDDIHFAHDNNRRFAVTQKATLPAVMHPVVDTATSPRR